MVVTRFAPSPSAQDPDITKRGCHIGTIRTTLYNWLLARKNKGIIFLRSENTDLQRSNDECLVAMLKDYEWLGIDFDAGIKVQNGKLKQFDNTKLKMGPFVQTERQEIHNKYINHLLEKNQAYEKDGAVYFKSPREDIEFDDTLLGKVKFPGAQLEDFVLRKSNGISGFYFGSACDDFLMGPVTNVLRCTEHINSTPKQIQLQKALGWHTPTYTHCGLIQDPSGKKLSKRTSEGQVITYDFKKAGYLPQALLNYVFTLGASLPSGKEKFTVQEMIDGFSLDRLNKAPSRFDYNKLKDLNSQYIKELSIQDFGSAIYKWSEEFTPGFIDKLNSIKDFPYFCKVFQPRCRILSDIIPLTKFLFEDIEYDEKWFKDDILIKIAEEFNKIEWTEENISHTINKLVEFTGLKIGKIAQPIRFACAGKISPEISSTLVLLGKEKTMNRINYCIDEYLVIKV